MLRNLQKPLREKSENLRADYSYYLGKELRNRQRRRRRDSIKYTNWLFTQNWISYEIGVASQRAKDVWVLSDSADINFPIPYLNNYYLWEGHLENPDQRQICRSKAYAESKGVKFDKTVKFAQILNVESVTISLKFFQKDSEINASCLRILEFSDGWLLNKNYPIQDHVRIIEEKTK